MHRMGDTEKDSLTAGIRIDRMLNNPVLFIVNSSTFSTLGKAAFFAGLCRQEHIRAISDSDGPVQSQPLCLYERVLAPDIPGREIFRSVLTDAVFQYFKFFVHRSDDEVLLIFRFVGRQA